jgi:acyl-CoA reductase-like NAD-dependent aldehyde dehydrogenase
VYATSAVWRVKALSGKLMPEGVGYFVPLTRVDNPLEDSRVVVDEAFGPVLPLLRFKDVDDVIRHANDSPYGLAGAVWSRDVDQAIPIAQRLETGKVGSTRICRTRRTYG